VSIPVCTFLVIYHKMLGVPTLTPDGPYLFLSSHGANAKAQLRGVFACPL